MQTWTNRQLCVLSALLCLLLAGDGAVRGQDRARQNAPQESGLRGRAATLLPDGRRLLSGGATGDGAVGTLVIEDPSAGTSRTLDVRLAHPRAWHSATALPDGTVLIFGGDSAGRVVGIAERFDPATGTLTSIGSLGLTARAGHTATLLSDGRVLMVGGASSAGGVATTEAWNLTTGAIEQNFGAPRHLRSNHTATLTEDGDVWISGGSVERDGRIADGELFLASTGQFIASTAPVPAAGVIVSGALPADNTSGVPESAVGAVRFSAPVDVRTVSQSSLALTGPDGVVAVASVVGAEGGRLAFVTPRTPLRPSSEYTLTVTGVLGLDGRPVPPASFRWRTREAPGSGAAAPPADDAVPRDPSGRPRSPWQDVPALQAPPGETALSGQVLRLNGQPLADVTFEIDGHVARSDARGRFLLRLDHQDSRHHELEIDGSTATAGGRTYGLFEVGVDVVGGRTTVLPYTVWMTALDTQHAVTIPSPTTTEVVVTTPKIPGLEVRIPPGTVIRDHEGNVVREVSITPIPLDQPPFPLPPDLEVPVYFTIQPGGAYIYTSGLNVTPGARLIYPNGLGFPNGKRMAFWQYDAEEKGWHVYGQGTVTGAQIVPDPRIAIYEFTQAMVADPNFGPEEGPTDEGEEDGDPVDLSTGLFVYSKTDLALPDVIPIELTRTYRQNDSRMRAFGVGTSHEYEMFLVGATNPWTYAELILADGTRLRYERISAGSGFEDAVFEHTTTPGRFYKSTIKYAFGFNVGWDLRLRDGTVYSFPDSEGASTPRRAAVVRIRDRNGNDVVLTRDEDWNLKQITSKHGRWIRLTYDTLNRITRAEDNIGREVLYTYDSIGRLETVTDPADGVSTFTYDAQHRMRTIRDPRNIVWLTNDYDANGRVILQTHADTTTYEFDYTLDGGGRVIQTDVTNPRGYVRRVTFNGSGYPLTDTLAFGTPLAQTTTYEREAGTNLPLAVIDALGRRTEYTYDTLGNALSVTRLADTPQAVTTTYTYDPVFSRIATITDPLNHTTTFTYDAHGNLIATTDANNNRRTVTYDALGRPVATIDGVGSRTELTYLGADLLQVVNPVGNTATHVADGAGRLTHFTNGAGDVTQYEYDALNQITKVIDAAQGETTSGFDPNGNLLTLTDARNKTTSYTYDTMDRADTREDPLLRPEAYDFDENGNLEEVTDRKGQITSYTYDALDRLSQITYDDLSTITYTYDAADRLLEVDDSVAGIVSRTYDGLDRVLSETTPEGVVNYTYDAADRRATMTVQGEPAVTYDYDVGDRLVSITKGSLVVAFGYDAADRRTTLTLPNDVVITSSYDAASRLTELAYTQGSTTLGTLSYAYDANGNRVAVGGTWPRTALPPALVLAVYDDANQITTWEGTPFTYDGNGNLTNDGVQTYTWNARDELTAVSGGVAAAFGYDGLGRRRAKTIAGSTTAFLYDGSNAVQELVGGAPSATILAGLELDEWFTRSDGDGTRHFLSDVLGSTVGLVDDAAVVRTEYTYQPFGATTATGDASANTSQFTGRENDATGLYYYRSRYHHQALQRFVAEDPQGFAAGDPNLYAYVYGNPTNWVDPTGELAVVAWPLLRAALTRCLGSAARGAIMEILAGRKPTLSGAAKDCINGLIGGGPKVKGPLGAKRGPGKGERRKAGKPEGTPDPYKHYRDHPTDPNKVIYKDPHTGKTVEKPRPPDYQPRRGRR